MQKMNGYTTATEKLDSSATSTFMKSSVLNGNTNTIITDTSTFLYSPAVSVFLASILPVIEKITSLPLNKLTPNAYTNALFTSLRNKLCRADLKMDEVSYILTHSAIIHYQSSLKEQNSSFEYFLEAGFAREIVFGKRPFEDFINYDYYESLVKFEMDTLKMYKNNVSIDHVAVIGSGPLPITSVGMLKHLPPSVVISNYDHCDEANELAKVVVNNKGTMFVENRTALKITAEDLDQVNLVFLVALVGNTVEEKKDIINHLYNVMKPGSILIGRTAVGLNTLIYNRLTEKEFGKFKNSSISFEG